jgi:4-amino-4-deoxy-L-arabinose transferase-like glycosyltransferase
MSFLSTKWQALAFALLSALSYPLLRYGVDLYTETGALFFYVLSFLITLWYLKRPSVKLIIANGLVISIGFLWKEYTIVNALFLPCFWLPRLYPQQRAH